MTKGTNYREYCPISWTKVLQEVTVAMNNYITKMSDKHSMPIRYFSQYKATVLEEVEHQIQMCQRRYSHVHNTFVPVLKDEAATNELDELQQQFVFTPVDKASKNIGGDLLQPTLGDSSPGDSRLL